jgi:hypothetical protein
MPPRPTLALARIIVRSYLNDDFHPIIVYGDLRIGKSSYALKALEQALSYLAMLGRKDKLTEDIVRRFMGWNPEENVDIWLDETERQPCFIWDDAGFWLHSLNWTDPVLISIMQYMNVVGTDYNCMIFTTPDPTWILSKIANMSGMIRVKIIKRDGTSALGDEQNYRKFARKGIGYKPWKSPDLKRGGVNKILEDKFSCKIDDELYAWYKPIRDRYAREAKLLISKNMKNASKKSRMEDMRLMKRLKALEKDLFDKVKDKTVVSKA